MAELRFFQKTRTNWAPAAIASDETATLFSVHPGDLIGPVFAYIRTAFDGTGGRTISLGDDGDVDRFMTTTIGDVSQAAGTYLMGLGGAGSNYLLLGRHLYTAANTIDVVFVAATGGAPSTGNLDFWYYSARVAPR